MTVPNLRSRDVLEPAGVQFPFPQSLGAIAARPDRHWSFLRAQSFVWRRSVPPGLWRSADPIRGLCDHPPCSSSKAQSACFAIPPAKCSSALEIQDSARPSLLSSAAWVLLAVGANCPTASRPFLSPLCRLQIDLVRGPESALQEPPHDLRATRVDALVGRL